jgi:hypothetical protein
MLWELSYGSITVSPFTEEKLYKLVALTITTLYVYIYSENGAHIKRSILKPRKHHYNVFTMDMPMSKILEGKQFPHLDLWAQITLQIKCREITGMRSNFFNRIPVAGLSS